MTDLPRPSRDVVVFGVGQVAEVMQYYIDHESDRRVVAFTVDGSYVKESTHLGLPVVAFEEVERSFPPASVQMFVAVSFRGINKQRAQKVQEAEQKGYSLIGHVSPKAVVWSGFELKPNTFIMENNVLQPYVRIGRDTILWSGNHIGHHSTIGDHCFIASHVVVSGSVTVGDGTFIGVNATLRDNITIGRDNVIGAGALILKDTNDEDVFIGPSGTLLPKKSSELSGI
jgi:sugar O-acyltransferase (sialic acid O-acetyltransferase NeuD family)